MAPNFEKHLNQTATYWASTGLSNQYGKSSFATPAPINCRWEERAEVFIDKRGQEKISKAKVFFASDIDLEGYLLLGTSASADPTTVAEAFEVQAVKKIPDLWNLKSIYVAML